MYMCIFLCGVHIFVTQWVSFTNNCVDYVIFACTGDRLTKTLHLIHNFAIINIKLQTLGKPKTERETVRHS